MGNAEDFTKQFMGDMFGGGKQQQYSGQLQVNQSENIDTSSNKPKKGVVSEKYYTLLQQESLIG